MASASAAGAVPLPGKPASLTRAETCGFDVRRRQRRRVAIIFGWSHWHIARTGLPFRRRTAGGDQQVGGLGGAWVRSSSWFEGALENRLWMRGVQNVCTRTRPCAYARGAPSPPHTPAASFLAPRSGRRQSGVSRRVPHLAAQGRGRAPAPAESRRAAVNSCCGRAAAGLAQAV